MFNHNYSNNILKIKKENTLFLIDQYTDVVFSQNESGLIIFQNIEDNKLIYSEDVLYLEKDLAYFLIYTANGSTCMKGMISITEDKELVLNKAYDYFSKFIIHS